MKAPKSDILLDSFSNGDLFPDTTGTNDGPILATSASTAWDKVAVQVWFASYNFNNRTRPKFRLLKL